MGLEELREAMKVREGRSHAGAVPEMLRPREIYISDQL